MIRDPQVTRPVLDTEADVADWFRRLFDAGVSFHPDDSFLDTVEANGFPTFTESDARAMDRAMERAHDLTDDPARLALDALRWHDGDHT